MPSSFFAALALGRRELQHLVVVELFLEVFTVGEEVEQLEGGFDGLLHAFLDGVVEKHLAEVVLAGAATLDLDEVGGREDRAEETDVEDVGAVVAGGQSVFVMIGSVGIRPESSNSYLTDPPVRTLPQPQNTQMPWLMSRISASCFVSDFRTH